MSEAQLQRITESIVGARRQHVRNVRVASVLGVIMLMALTILLVAFAGRETAGRPAVTSHVPGGPASTEAQIYAQVLGGAHGSGRVYVSTQLCTGMVDIAGGKRGPCPGGTISAQEQRQIRALTGEHVVFRSSPPRPGPATVMRLGTVLVLGGHAEVAYDVTCGPLCGNGETVFLTRLDGRWTRTGTGGYSWIS